MELHNRVLTLNWIDRSESWQLTHTQKLLYTWLIWCFDANGVIELNPSLILKKLDLKELKRDLEILLAIMIDAKVLEPFTFDGVNYAFSKDILKSQSLRYKAKLPNPPWLRELQDRDCHFKYLDSRTDSQLRAVNVIDNPSEVKTSYLEVKNIKDKNIANAQETIQNIRQNLQARG